MKNLTQHTFAALAVLLVLAASQPCSAALGSKKKEKTPAVTSITDTSTVPAFATAALRENHPLAGLWNDTEFVKRFMGEYGFNSEIEPKMTNPEEVAFYKTLPPLIRENPTNAMTQLEAKLKPESSAVLNFTLGMLYFQNDRTADAVKQFEQAVLKFPDYRRAHKNLGFAQVRLQKYDDAIRPLTRTIELGGVDGNTYGLLGFCYLSAGKNVSAEAAYKNAMLFAPENADWKLGVIKAQIGQGRLKEAAELIDEMLAKTPTSDSLWSLQAGVFMQMNELNKAAVNYEFLRKLGKVNVQTLFLLGDIYMTQGAKELALPVYVEAISKDEGKNLPRALRAADVLTSRGAWEEARAMFRQIRETHQAKLAPEEELKLLKLESKVALANGSGDEAIRTLEKVVEKNPLEGEALLMIGEYYARNGEKEKAEFRFDMASKITGFEAEAFVKHAQMLVTNQKYERAVELLLKAQKLRPRDNVQRYLEAVQRTARGRG